MVCTSFVSFHHFATLASILFLGTFSICLGFSLNTKTSPGTNRRPTLTPGEVRQIQEEQEEQARSRHNNNVMNALFLPSQETPLPVPLQPEKPLPYDLQPGALLRIGPNGGDVADGWLDGDGMVHCITFPPSDNNVDDQSETSSSSSISTTYSATYIGTRGRKLEQEMGKSYIGSLGGAPRAFPMISGLIQNMINFKSIRCQKDTCNTAVAEHGGQILALMEQCFPSEIVVGKDGTVRTTKSESSLNGAIPNSDPLTGGGFSAHGKTCPDTGERIHVSYSSSNAPFGRVDIFSGEESDAKRGTDGSGWNLKKSVGIDLPCPVMIHDCAITKNYVVVLDFPLTIRPRRILNDEFPVSFDPENGARIGLLPRDSNSDESIRWFDCEPGVVLHTINAYETDDDMVVFHALRSEPKEDRSFISDYTTAFLYEWEINLKSGEVSERCLNPQTLAEFPTIDDRHTGKETLSEVYAISVSTIGGPLNLHNAPREAVVFDGIIKFDLKGSSDKQYDKGDVIDKFTLPKGWNVVTEPTVVPKVGSSEGVYVIFVGAFLPSETEGKESFPSNDKILRGDASGSRVFVLDGDNIEKGPVWEADLPFYVGYGLHSAYVPWDKLS